MTSMTSMTTPTSPPSNRTADRLSHGLSYRFSQLLASHLNLRVEIFHLKTQEVKKLKKKKTSTPPKTNCKSTCKIGRDPKGNIKYVFQTQCFRCELLISGRVNSCGVGFNCSHPGRGKTDFFNPKS